MSAFFAMGGYAAFVWPAYVITVAALAVTTAVTWRAWRTAQARLAALEAEKP
jgi:heme exporter protein D